MLRHCILGVLWSSLAMGAVDFQRQVAPVLESRCQMCHGERQQMGNLRLDTAAGIAKAQTKIIERVKSEKAGFRMPPVGAPLAQPQIAMLEEWIAAGATVPSAYRPAGAAKPVLWSLQPVTKPGLPAVKNKAWVRNPIDAFVLARLEKEGITPSPEAGKLTLLRRASFDLTGLPPTHEQVRRYMADTRPDAYDRMVDELLQSRHYGEKWARHWLDLAHYADSDGYEKDRVRSYAWRYRNWVIEALNADMPFDRFTIEQLAGDLLPNPTEDQLVATGFARNTLTNREAGVDRGEARFEQLLSRANTVGTTWLGLTVGCAQCHDHKYDPISQKDFFRLFAFFDAAEEMEAEAPLGEERRLYEQSLPSYLAWRGHVLQKYEVAKYQAIWEDQIRAAMDKPGEDVEFDFWVTSMRAMFDHADRVLRTPPAKRSLRDQQRLTDYFLQSIGPVFNRDREIREKLIEARQKVQELQTQLPEFTMAMAMRDNPDYKGTHLRVKGDWKTMGDPVEAGGLAVLPAMHSASGSGGRKTRMDLAKWLVARENPLTARVTVNRAWQELFGRGLVLTSEDFGTQGEKPTHPELLDWLAARFVDDDRWSMKKLHKLIVTSATYRQSSDVRPEIAERDADNSLLARQSRKRLAAELIRDAALEAGGLLVRNEIGGPSVRPFQPKGVAELGYANSVKWTMSEGEERYRRGLYIHFQRTTPYPQLMNFDAPDSNVSCSRRRPSNTPLQSLNLLNDPVFFEAAQALARRVFREAKPNSTFADRLTLAFEAAIGRPPDQFEVERLARYYDQQLGIVRAEPAAVSHLAPEPVAGADRVELAAWTGLSRVVLNLDEFLTRE